MAEEENQGRPYFEYAVKAAEMLKERTGFDLNPEWIYAQWRHESYNPETGEEFGSRLFKENLNPGGLTQGTPNGEENKQTDGGTAYYRDYVKEGGTESGRSGLDGYVEDYVDEFLAKYDFTGVTSARDFVHVLKANDYFTDNETSYANDVAAKAEDQSPLTLIGSIPVDNQFHNRYGHDYIADAPEPYKERSAIARFAESAQDALLDSGVTSSLRYMWSWVNPEVRGTVSIPGFSTPYSPTDEEIKYVKDLMPGDPTAQNYVLTNAYSQQHLFMLAAMKKQDYDRALRLYQDSKMQGWNIAGFTGGIVGGMLDPATLGTMAFGGLGGAGAFAKVVGRLGTNAMKLSQFAKIKAVRMAANAATGASLMGADRFLANRYGGFEANYLANMTQAAVLGNAFDAMRLVKHALPKSKPLQNVYAHLSKSEDHLLTATLGLHPTDTIQRRVNAELRELSSTEVDMTVRKTGKEAKAVKARKDNLKETGKLTDENMPQQTTKQVKILPAAQMQKRLKMSNKEMEDLGLRVPTEKDIEVRGLNAADVRAQDMQRNRFVLSAKQATDFAVQHGIKITKKTASFAVPGTGQFVIVGDRIKSKTHLKRAIADSFTKSRGLVDDVLGSGWVKALLQSKTFNPKGFTSLHELIDDLNFAKLRSFKEGTAEHAILNEARKNILALRGVRRKVSDKKLAQWIQWASDEQKYRDTPIHVDPNGTAYVFDTTLGRENPMNPNTEDMWAKDQNAVTKDMQSSLPDIMPKKLGKTLETYSIFKTIYGVLGHSTCKLVRELNDRLFMATRGRANGGSNVVVAERMKRYLQDRVKPIMNDYYDARNEWMDKHKHYKYVEQHRLDFDRQVQTCYNATYAGNTRGLSPNELVWDDSVIKAAEAVHKIRETCRTIMQEDPRMHGGLSDVGSYMDSTWKLLDDEFNRKVDREALTRLIRFMGTNTKNLKKQMVSYAKMAVKRNIVRQQLEMEAERTFKAEHLKWEEQMSKLKEGQKPPKEPKLRMITDKVLEEEIEDRAQRWAVGIIDQMEYEASYGGGKFGVSIPSFVKHRLPMDTTTKMPLTGVDGSTIDFSFDTFLRDVNTDRILSSYIDRVCGEVAAHSVLGNWRAKGVLDKIYKELDDGVTQGHLTKAQADEQKNAIKEGLSRLLSTDIDGTPKTAYEAFSSLFRTMGYANNGAQMWLAQLGEYGSAIGYSGVSVLLRSIPIIRDIRKAMLSGKESQLEDIAKMLQEQTWGRSLEPRFWDRNASYQSTSFRDAWGYSSRVAKALDNFGAAEKIFSNITSTLNCLPKLTDCMIRQTHINGIIDSIKWAHGETFSLVREPFSDYFLKAAHVKDVKALKADIIKYIGNKNVTPDAIETWRKTNPDTFFQWRNLMENYSNRSIQQMSIGNTPLLKEKNWFTKLLFQFKDYSMRAVNDQTLRALSTGQMDDYLAAAYSMGTNCMSYMGLTYIRAYTKYPNDPEKRKEYLDKQLSVGMLAWAAISRGAIVGSIPSFGNDIWEIATGQPMFRTTVNNTPGYTEPGAGGIITRGINQMPAISGVADPMLNGMSAIGNKFTGEEVSRDDIASVMKLLPMNSFVGLTLAASEIQDLVGLRTKKEIKAEQKKKEEKAKKHKQQTNSGVSALMSVK